MNLKNWLLLNPPAAEAGQPAKPAGRLGDGDGEDPELGPQPGLRKAASFVAIFLGVLVSFFITGLPSKKSAQDQASAPPAQVQPADPQAGTGIQVQKPALPALKLGLVALVITLLSYPAFYFNLKLYSKTPVLIVFCVAFQNGYFWHALIYGVAS
jgi:hypothetical protein